MVFCVCALEVNIAFCSKMRAIYFDWPRRTLPCQEHYLWCLPVSFYDWNIIIYSELTNAALAVGIQLKSRVAQTEVRALCVLTLVATTRSSFQTLIYFWKHHKSTLSTKITWHNHLCIFWLCLSLLFSGLPSKSLWKHVSSPILPGWNKRNRMSFLVYWFGWA